MQNFEKNCYDRLEDFLSKQDDTLSCFEAMKSLGEAYGPFGHEKVKILENSFDIFLENILSGPGLKQEFYAIDKNLPKSYIENESFLKMKKFQQYEKYPDDNVREYIIHKQT